MTARAAPQTVYKTDCSDGPATLSGLQFRPFQPQTQVKTRFTSDGQHHFVATANRLSRGRPCSRKRQFVVDTQGTRAVVDGWLKSPGHCQNIMNATFKNVGVGYAYSASSTYEYYLVTDFGTLR